MALLLALDMSARALYARRVCGAAAGATLSFLSGSACAEQQQPKTAFGGAFAQPTFAESAIAQAKGRKLQSFTTVAQAPTQMVIISPTFFPSVDDVRCQLGLQAVRKAKSLGIPILLVDASPAPVRAALEEAGAVVRPQMRAGKKGAALRECVESALEQFQLMPEGVICYQELEKVEMIPLQAEVAAFMLRSGTDVCVPKREDGLFRATYPVEQYHSEHFANLHLDALGRPVGLPALDWTFGPVAFRASMARHWLQCRQQAQTRRPRSGSAGHLRLERPRACARRPSGLQSRATAAWAPHCTAVEPPGGTAQFADVAAVEHSGARASCGTRSLCPLSTRAVGTARASKPSRWATLSLTPTPEPSLNPDPNPNPNPYSNPNP